MIGTSTFQRITGYWRRLTSGSVNRRIFGSIMTVGVFTIGVKTISFAKELIVAQAFGTGDALDAFLVAFGLTNYLAAVVAMPFGSAMLPSFVREREQAGEEAAQRLLATVVLLVLALVGGASVLLVALGPLLLPLIGSGFAASKLALTFGMLLVLAPSVLLAGLNELASTTANLADRFAFTAMSGAAVPIATVASVLLLRPQLGVYALAVGVLAGMAIQSLLLAWRLRRDGVSLWPRWDGWTPALARVLRQYWPVVAGAALHNSSVLIDQAMATPLGSGSVAVLNYGNKLVALVQGVGATALGVAILPYFARMIAASDWRSVRQALRFYTRLILAVGVPFALLAALGSHAIIESVYQRGAFTAADTLLVSQVQAMFVLQLLCYTLGILFVQLILSLGTTRVMMWGTLLNVTLNVVLNYVLQRWLGVVGIALSTTLVYVASSIYLFVMLQRMLSAAEGGDHAADAARAVTPGGRG